MVFSQIGWNQSYNFSCRDWIDANQVPFISSSVKPSLK